MVIMVILIKFKINEYYCTKSKSGIFICDSNLK